MQVYLGDTPMDYSGIKLGDTNISTLFRGILLPETQAFINATGITNPVQINAINDLIIGMQQYNIWGKMYAVYPFVGGTATTHKYNLMNPQDTNAAFRLEFNGGWTHNSNGITANGTLFTYATTHFSSANNASLFFVNSSLGVYVRNNTSTGYDMGAYDVGTYQLGLISRYTDGKFYAGLPLNSTNTVTTASSVGLSAASRLGNNIKGYRNNSTILNLTNDMLEVVVNVFRIGSTYGDDNSSSNRNYAFAFIGQGLTESEMNSYYNVIQSYQTSLGRQV